jgi:predicted transcriptional regulator of viral defense system
MHYHHLTQQTPSTVFALTSKENSIPRSIDKKKYYYVQVKPEHYFGIKKIWVGEAQVSITDIERTLLDGLMAPQYCGDFQEVLYAFKVAEKNLNLDTLIEYALLLNTSTLKRLGWILDRLTPCATFSSEGSEHDLKK